MSQQTEDSGTNLSSGRDKNIKKPHSVKLRNKGVDQSQPPDFFPLHHSGNTKGAKSSCNSPNWEFPWCGGVPSSSQFLMGIRHPDLQGGFETLDHKAFPSVAAAVTYLSSAFILLSHHFNIRVSSI